jgi:hypothetical protein
MRNNLSRFYKEDVSLDRIEDLLYGIKPMLSQIVEDLVFKGKLNQAKGLCIRHNLFGALKNEETKQRLSAIDYDLKNDIPSPDIFGPITKDTLILPKDVQIDIISEIY